MSNPVLDSVKKVRDFMLGDLNKTANLDKTPEHGPNFLLALALCCYTEYWGKLVSENKLNSTDSFNAFFIRLGNYYDMLIKSHGNKIYSNVRCGLAHAYLIEKDAEINMGHGPCGIEYDGSNRTYRKLIETVFDIDIIRIERTSDENEVSFKWSDYSIESIDILIRQGVKDTLKALTNDFLQRNNFDDKSKIETEIVSFIEAVEHERQTPR